MNSIAINSFRRNLRNFHLFILICVKITGKYIYFFIRKTTYEPLPLFGYFQNYQVLRLLIIYKKNFTDQSANGPQCKKSLNVLLLHVSKWKYFHFTYFWKIVHQIPQTLDKLTCSLWINHQHNRLSQLLRVNNLLVQILKDIERY